MSQSNMLEGSFRQGGHPGAVSLSRRRVLALCAAGATGTLLAACGASTSTSASTRAAATKAAASTASRARAPSQATAVPSSVFKGTQAQKTILVWDWAAGWEQLLQKLATTYVHDNPQAALNLQIQPGYFTKLPVALAGGTGPDAYRMVGRDVFSWDYRKQLVDLTSMINQNAKIKTDYGNMAKPSRDAVTYHGNVVAMPFGGTLIMTIYNTDLVKAAGLTPPAELGSKWDWNKVVEYGEKLTKRGNGPHPSVYGFWATEDWEQGWLNWVLANGGYFLDPTKNYRVCLLDQPQAIGGVQDMVDLVLKYKVSPTTQELSSENGATLFYTGKIAITTMGSWGIPQVRQAKINFDIAMVPYSPNTGKSASDSNFSATGINPASKVQEETAKYVLWTGTEEAQKIIGSFEFMPASVPAIQQTYLDPKFGPAHRSILADVLKITTPQPEPDVVAFTDVMDNLTQKEIPLLFGGHESVQKGFGKVTQEVNARIQQAVKAG
ncbi:MAG: sugar ABC transporter substrate-binding protein [Chloroflexi bacterium]|nr:sugar ABC transporter substrate-binding protein [Chloroflexota bacterium]